MISDKNINASSLRICLSLFPLQQCTLKQLLDSFFCDILNNQGLCKCYQPRVISSIHDAVRVDANFTSIEVSMFLNGKDFE